MPLDWTALIALGVLAILLTTLWIAVELRAIRKALDDQGAALQSNLLGGLKSSHDHQAKAGRFVVWRWSNGRWVADLAGLPPGTDPGPPPAYPGKYEGETLRLWVPFSSR